MIYEDYGHKISVDLYRPVVHRAVSTGSLHRVEFFTKSMSKEEFRQCVGPDRNGRYSSFVCAARYGQYEILKYMMERGADPNTTGQVEFDGELISDAPALWAACAAGHMEIVEHLVEVGKADINAATSSSSTPLRGACFDGHLDIVKYLVNHGANIEAANKHGHTPLMIAAFRKQNDIVQYLLESAADVKRKSVRGNTALHDAAEVGDPLITGMLIDAGGENVADEYGTTPFMCAAYLGRVRLFQILTPKASRGELRDCYKLLGAHFLDRTHDIQEAVRCWEISIMIDTEMRNNGECHLFELPDSSKEVYGGVTEIQTLQELQNISADPERMKIQALMIRERILGGHHSETIYALRYRGALFCDMGQFDQCMHIWKHALNLQQHHLCPLHPGIIATFGTFLETFVYATNERVINGSAVCFNKQNVLSNVMIVLDRLIFEFERYMRKEKKIDFDDVFIDCVRTLGLELKQLLLYGLHIMNLVFRLETSVKVQQGILEVCSSFTDCKGLGACCPRYNPKFVETPVVNDGPISDELHQFGTSYDRPVICVNLQNHIRSFIKISGALGLNVLHLLFETRTMRVDEVQFPCVTLMNLLLKAGATPNKVDENGNMPLHCLMKSSFPRITLAQSLIAHDALVHARNKSNETCYELIRNRKPNWNLGHPISLLGLAANAVRRGNIQFKGIVPHHLEAFIDLH
ncbi:hypothetical protein L596_004309 [Steinernema carpocapsae]|uniref:Uncharacterized protein n=1 Tax=Steinernema carpocapsae TaxID=34508 RepID=A0A4U8UWY8_STECR|nr:hypothetical protein L596_004309 [Steinernema carpocapsae]